MSTALRMTVAALGPLLTILFIATSKARPIEANVQLMSVSFGVSGVVMAIGYVVRLRRGPGAFSVTLTSAMGLGLVELAVVIGAATSPEVRAWALVLLFTAPAFSFPSVFGAALATCAGVRTPPVAKTEESG